MWLATNLEFIFYTYAHDDCFTIFKAITIHMVCGNKIASICVVSFYFILCTSDSTKWSSIRHGAAHKIKILFGWLDAMSLTPPHVNWSVFSVVCIFFSFFFCWRVHKRHAYSFTLKKFQHEKWKMYLYICNITVSFLLDSFDYRSKHFLFKKKNRHTQNKEKQNKTANSMVSQFNRIFLFIEGRRGRGGSTKNWIHK